MFLAIEYQRLFHVILALVSTVPLLCDEGKDKQNPVAVFVSIFHVNILGLLMTLTLRAGTLNVRAIGYTQLVVLSGNKKIGGKKMGTNFQYSKTLAMEGSILITLGLVPYVGWVLGIVGIVLLLRAMKEFANYYQDNSIYQNSLTGVKYYIVALVALAVAGGGFVVAFVNVDFNNFPASFGVGHALGLAVGIAFLLIAFIFYVLAATHLRKTFSTLAQKTGEHSFETAATLLWIGALLTIIGVGALLIFIAWIFAVIGFFTIRNPQQQQQYAPQPYGYTSPPIQPAAGPTPTYCSNCGAPLKSEATYCSNCGKKVD